MSALEDRDNNLLVTRGNELLRHVIPLFRIPSNKRPELIGTALLVNHSGNSYMVSAKHVIDNMIHPSTLYYYVDRDKLMQLFGNVIHTIAPSSFKGQDSYDIAVVRLQEESRPPYPGVSKDAIPSSFLKSIDLPRVGKEYIITGFPASKSRANPNRKQLKSDPSSFGVASANPAQYLSLNLQHETHLVMPLDVEKMTFPDGSIRRISDPHGMSGSPVWLYPDLSNTNNREFNYVVGIVIEYHKNKKLLVATDIGVALQLIKDNLD